ncbi:MAG: hypothetical protein HY814_08520 [Candidatus Riflebacteria bacterium]|nr:hypothetical protein [Candidatus Riflebacteria bacterium]
MTTIGRPSPGANRRASAAESPEAQRLLAGLEALRQTSAPAEAKKGPKTSRVAKQPRDAMSRLQALAALGL